MTENETELIAAVKAFVLARQTVKDWCTAEGKALRLVTNSQAPGWKAYREAEDRMWLAIDGVGREGKISPNN